MAIHIKGYPNICESSFKESILHFMPCHIQCNSNANVAKYFTPYINKSDDGKGLSTSFRGYPLRGSVVMVPDGYQGIVFYEHKKPISENVERNVFITNSFKSLAYWNWDKVPSKNDAFLSALDWIQISEAVHTPLEE